MAPVLSGFYFYSFLCKALLLYTASYPLDTVLSGFYFYSFLGKALLLYTASCLLDTVFSGPLLL